MRHRTLLAPLALTAALLGTHPASAANAAAPQPVSADARSDAQGWEPAPSAPWDVGAGVRCDFPVHGEPVVDEVEQRVLSTHPDGTARWVAYRGDLVIRVTNTDTGASHDADASGSALVEYRDDGSQFWAVHGPVLVGLATGNLPRGLYIIDGAYTMDIGTDGSKNIALTHATTDDLCARID
ncbi:hypothetical protein [Streptomyces sp. NPDC007929]|uniref:hypothetical protein n=1 Tax=unclassified Streptomyces TaxID=2593676 RepID=UPI0036EE9498